MIGELGVEEKVKYFMDLVQKISLLRILWHIFITHDSKMPT